MSERMWINPFSKGDIDVSKCDILFNIPLDKRDCVVYQLTDNAAEVYFVLSYSNSKIVQFQIRVFKDFLSGIERTITKAIEALCDNECTTKISFKANKGICKIKATFNPVTKLDYNFPVNDECSYGKVTLGVKDLVTIRDYLKGRNLL